MLTAYRADALPTELSCQWAKGLSGGLGGGDSLL